MSHAVLNEQGITALLSPAGPVALDLERRAVHVQNRARILASGALVNVQTGRYRASILAGRAVADSEHGLRVSVGSNVDYAIILELGSQPHRISPRNKQALWWGDKHGTTMRTPAVVNSARGSYSGKPLPIFGSVQHPGIKARHVLTTALSAAAG